MKKQKFIVLFVKVLNGRPLVVGIRNIDISKDKISYKKRFYEFDGSAPVYTKGKKTYYMVNIDSKQIRNTESPEQDIISSEILDQIISKEIVRQMIDAVKPAGLMEKLMFLGMGLLGGVGIGIMIAGYL